MTLSVPSSLPSSVCFSWEHSMGKLSFDSFIIPHFCLFGGNNWTLMSESADGELHRRCVGRSAIASASAALLAWPTAVKIPLQFCRSGSIKSS